MGLKHYTAVDLTSPKRVGEFQIVESAFVVDMIGMIGRIGPDLGVCTGLISSVELLVADYDPFVLATDSVDLVVLKFFDTQAPGAAGLDAATLQRVEERTAEPEVAVVDK